MAAGSRALGRAARWRRYLGRGRLAVPLGAGLVAALVWAPPGRAEPLAKEACDGLKAEHAKLEAAGLPETLKKGAAWGKANLSREKLQEVARFITLEEQLLFRCGLAAQRGISVPDGEDGDSSAAAAAKDAPKEAAATPPLPKPKPPPKAKPKTAGEPAAAATASTAAGEDTKPKVKPKPKPKVDDAYRPPPPGPATEGATR